MNKMHLLAAAFALFAAAGLSSCAVTEPTTSTTTTTTTRSQTNSPVNNAPVETVGSGRYGY